MFEIIGMAVVAWVAWNVLKAILAIAAKRTLERAITFAASRGVPHDAAKAILEQPELVKKFRKDLARANPDFAALDVHEQYGNVIKVLHVGMPRDTEIELDRTKEEVEKILRPQIASLKLEGAHVSVDYITFVYVGALAWALSKNAINSSEIKSIVEHCFNGKRHAFEIENAWTTLLHSSDFEDKLNSMGAIAEAESAAGKGEFFAKFTRKHNRNGGLATGPRQDLSKVTANWFLEV